MGGGLLQLVAYGAQDVYLTGNPQITFWKVSYRRYTNFSMESIRQSFSGNLTALGGRATCQISRNGDLIHKVYLEVVTTTAGTVTSTKQGGLLALVKTVEVEIGGQLIDKQYGYWMYLWNSLSLPAAKMPGYKNMVGADFDNTDSALDTAGTYRLPLEFWFCRNPGLALPLIALQYHEVKINIQLATAGELGANGVNSDLVISSSDLWVDYIFLDTDERRRMAQNPHEYLIDQLQFTGTETVSGTTHTSKLNFNHPVKELIWSVRAVSAQTAAVDLIKRPLGLVSLKLNGHDRFAPRLGKWFTEIQPYQHHTNIPMGGATVANDTNGIFELRDTGTTNANIHVYSFALRPEEHQPSGTCNFSRIDTAVLTLEANGLANSMVATDRVDVFAVNYNVLRIMSGMGGLAYSN